MFQLYALSASNLLGLICFLFYGPSHDLFSVGSAVLAHDDAKLKTKHE